MQHCSFCFSRKPSFRERGGRFAFCNSKCQIQYYFINGSDEKKRKTTSVHKFSTCDNFGEVITIPIAQIICGQLRIGRDWKLVLSSVQCTAIGARVARSLVRVASTRIFAVPEQSILEPIVNSIDAYFPDQKTGKFGMGFFSMLYWVVNNNAQLVVHSTYRLGDGTFCGYMASIFAANDGTIMITLQDNDDDNINSSGTIVSVTFQIDNDLEKRFIEQLDKLQLVPLANILFNDNFLNPTRMTPTSPKIYIELSKDGFTCRDKASGITREVLLGSLLFPTVSTKTIQMSTKQKAQEYDPAPTVIKQEKNMLTVLVNNIAVIHVKFITDLKEKVHIVIDLPPWTRIPVSRDDVDLSSVATYFKRNMDKLETIFIYSYRNLISLQTAMEEFARQTASDDNRKIISDWENSKNNLAVFIPHQHKQVYHYINSQFNLSSPFVVSKKWNVSEIEKAVKLIHGHEDNNIFVGRSVFFLDTIEKNVVTTGGLSKYLFVDKERTLEENWTVNLMAAFYETTLYPITLEKPKSVANFNYLIDNASITNKQRELLAILFNQEETALRNGWNSIDLKAYNEYSINSYITLLTNGLMTDTFLEIITQKWYPTFLSGPTKSIYGGQGTETYRVFIIDEFKSELGFNEHYSIKTLLYKKKYAKAMRFSEELFELCVTTNIANRANVNALHLSHVYEMCILPLESIMLDTFTNGLLELLLEKTSTMLTFYQCCKTLIHIVIRSNNMAKINKTNLERIANQFLFFVQDSHKNETTIPMSDYYLPNTFDNTHEPTRRCADAFINWLKEITNEPDVIYKLPQFTPSKTATTFTLNEFIGYAFKENLPSKFDKNMLATDSLKTQMIEIVVNEGTSKEPSIAQLTEMIQNSIDAIREHNQISADIDIEIYHVDDIMVLTVTDYVGISWQGIIAMSIPFYSTKTPNQIMTGEMGTGFFNVYRSDTVHIYTSSRGTVFDIYDVPIKDATTNRVMDVRRYITSFYDKYAPNKTTITITTRFEKNVHIEVSRAKLYVQKVLSMIDAQITLNRSPIRVKRTLFKKTNVFEFYIVESDEDVISYVMTKGIPFAPLDSLNIGVDGGAMKLIRVNCFVNILSGYTPVQTRTKITMDTNGKKDLARFITNCAYDYVISKPVNEVGKYIEHYEAGKYGNSVDVNQVKPDRVDLDDEENNTSESVFISNYGDMDAGSINSIGYYIEEIIEHWESGEELTGLKAKMRAIDNENDENILYFTDLLDPKDERDRNRFKIVKAWFQGKNNPIINPKLEYRTAVTKKEDHPMRVGIQQFIYAWIDLYVEIGKSLGIFPQNKYLRRVYVLDNGPKGVAGSYSPEEESIYYYIENDEKLWFISMVMSIFSIRDDQKMSERIMEYERSHSFWKDVFSPRGTLAHEVEHFRRHSSHKVRGVHSNILVDLPEGGLKIRSYDECCADTMISILKSNFYVRLRNRMKQTTLPLDIQMRIFNEASALNKFKMLLAADKDMYRHLSENAPWKQYVEREFDIDIPPHININFRWLYWALVVTNSQSLWRVNIIYFKKQSITKLANFSLWIRGDNGFTITIFENNKREFMNKFYGSIEPFVRIISESLTPEGHELNITVEKMPGRQSTVWMIYAFLSIGYNVELKEPENVLSEKAKYYVRSHI